MIKEINLNSDKKPYLLKIVNTSINNDFTNIIYSKFLKNSQNVIIGKNHKNVNITLDYDEIKDVHLILMINIEEEKFSFISMSSSTVLNYNQEKLTIKENQMYYLSVDSLLYLTNFLYVCITQEFMQCYNCKATIIDLENLYIKTGNFYCNCCITSDDSQFNLYSNKLKDIENEINSLTHIYDAVKDNFIMSRMEYADEYIYIIKSQIKSNVEKRFKQMIKFEIPNIKIDKFIDKIKDLKFIEKSSVNYFENLFANILTWKNDLMRIANENGILLDSDKINETSIKKFEKNNNFKENSKKISDFIINDIMFEADAEFLTHDFINLDYSENNFQSICNELKELKISDKKTINTKYNDTHTKLDKSLNLIPDSSNMSSLYKNDLPELFFGDSNNYIKLYRIARYLGNESEIIKSIKFYLPPVKVVNVVKSKNSKHYICQLYIDCDVISDFYNSLREEIKIQINNYIVYIKKDTNSTYPSLVAYNHTSLNDNSSKTKKN